MFRHIYTLLKEVMGNTHSRNSLFVFYECETWSLTLIEENRTGF
jgi:hypothetical protein